MSAETGSTERPSSTEGPSSTERRSETGSPHRAERRSARRAVRRRKAMTRLSFVAGPIVVVILVIVALLVFLGGPESTSGAETTTTTVGASPVEGSSMLFIEQGETVSVVVVLLPEEEGGLALAMPGNMLLKTGESGFKTLAELHASNQDEALREGLARDLALEIGATASVQWSELREALTGLGKAGSLPTELQATEEDAADAAGAALTILGASGAGEGAAVWDQMEIAGDPEGFRAAVGLLGESISEGGWTEEVLPGKVVEGVGFEFFEPDLGQARALLAGESAGAVITVEVQNGSGVVGVAQQVGAMLEPLGYDLLPFRNADDFPDVKSTRIITAPDASAEAQRVQEALGVGRIEQDDSLDPGRVIVVVGKDFIPPASAETEPTG